MRILDIPQTGKSGTTVSVRTRYGQIRRRYAVPRTAPSLAQLRIRSNFGRLPSRWRALTDEQRAIWGTSAQNTNSRPSLGQSGHLAGYSLFVKINSILACQGLAPVVLPTERPTFDANPVCELLITNTGGRIELKLRVPTAPSAHILVLGTRPRSPGVTFAKHFAILGALPAAEAGYSNITDLYIDRYGPLPVGMRIFIRTRQLLNGWEDDPQQTTAIVPAP
jgi:hypothetical protein